MPKEHLLRVVWGGEIIDGSNLTQAVAQTRKVLGTPQQGIYFVSVRARNQIRFLDFATESQRMVIRVTSFETRSRTALTRQTCRIPYREVPAQRVKM
ncbi:MAG: hypothetical protein ACJ746_16935 [Bryobacteraceae bacterium]